MRIEENTVVNIVESSKSINFREFWKLLVKNNQSFTVQLIIHQNSPSLFDHVPVIAYQAKAKTPRNVDGIAEEIYVAIKNTLRKEALMERKVSIIFYESISSRFKNKIETFVTSHTAVEGRINVSEATSGQKYKVL